MSAAGPAPALGTVATPPSPVPPPPLPRRRAWLLLGVVALVVLVYLTGFSVWAHTYTSTRYTQLAPGAAGTRGGAEFRLLTLTRSAELADAGGGEPQVADAGATFVVAEVEVVRQVADEGFLCGVDLLGPGGRVWSATTVEVQRPVPSCRSTEVAVGRPTRFESVFLVPERYADQLVGAALTDNSGPGRSAVLRPPA